MIRCKGSFCKEDLQKLIDETDWGEPKGKHGKHFKYFDAVIDSNPDNDGNDCSLSWSKPKEEWGTPATPFLLFRTLARHKHYMNQRFGSVKNNSSNSVKDESPKTVADDSNYF
ncbi:MAG: hypothetical protein ACRCX5_14395 [Bacteroidales bacterium]